MLGTSVLRVAVILCLSLVPIGASAKAVTILWPVHEAMTRDAKAAPEAISGAVNQAAIIPSDRDPALWSLLAGGIVLFGTAMRRKRRMPSVTS